MKSLLIPTAIVLASLAPAQAQLQYTTGLDVWLDATDIDGQANTSLTDADLITTWTNKGTTEVNDAMPVSGTTSYSAEGGAGGRGSVTLDRSRYQFGQEFVDSPSVTMYFVVKRADTSDIGALFTDYGDDNQTLYVRTGPEDVSGVRDSAGTSTTVSTGIAEAEDEWTIVFFSLDASTGTVTYGNLGQEKTETNASHVATTTFETPFAGPVTLFSFHDGNSRFYFDGEASEVLIYDHLLDEAAREQVESYLKSRMAPASDRELRITDVTRNPNGSITLVWNSDPGVGTEYSVFLSEDLSLPADSWSDDNDGLETGGITTSYTIPAERLPDGASKLFFRVQKN
ncbi:hypothetical protein V2O64_23000 [Verrucomicrobiaceae bacterium 227]